jgi:amino acid adenylation domain-containing protein
MRMERFLSENARRLGGKTALVAGDRRLTYAELDTLSDRLAAGLAASGVRRDDRVLIFMDNCWEAAVSIFATLKAGAAFSPVNPSTKADKLAFIMGNCRPAAIVTQARLAGVAAEARTLATTGENGLEAMTIVSTAAHGGKAPDGTVPLPELLSADAAPPAHGGIDVDLGMLIYTSGSTGRPKGVMMTHRNMDAASESITGLLENREDDVILSVLPLSFNYGLYQLLMAVRLGATLVLEKSFAFPQAIIERMREEGATGFPLVPTMSAMVLQMRDLKPDLVPTLRYITNTAAALPPTHVAQLRALFPQAKIYSMYGLTECKRCTCLPPEELDRRPDSVGIAIPNTEVFVVGEDGRPVPPGEVGELVVRGPLVMQGYWDNPEATAQMLRPGFKPWEKVLHTGDLFRADVDGFLYFVARKDDIIKTRGEKVAPKEVEAVLQAHPGIADAVVFGVPDPVLGHAIAAMVIALDPALTEREIVRHCAVHLEDFMVPRSIEFRTELPKTDTGKVSRRLAADNVEPAE